MACILVGDHTLLQVCHVLEFMILRISFRMNLIISSWRAKAAKLIFLVPIRSLYPNGKSPLVVNVKFPFFLDDVQMLQRKLNECCWPNFPVPPVSLFSEFFVQTPFARREQRKIAWKGIKINRKIFLAYYEDCNFQRGTKKSYRGRSFRLVLNQFKSPLRFTVCCSRRWEIFLIAKSIVRTWKHLGNTNQRIHRALVILRLSTTFKQTLPRTESFTLSRAHMVKEIS